MSLHIILLISQIFNEKSLKWVSINKSDTIKGTAIYIYPEFSSTELEAQLQSLFDCAFQISLQTPAKVFEHGRTTGQDNILQINNHIYQSYDDLINENYFVKGPPDIDGTVLNDSVYHFWDGCCEIRIAEFGMKEDLWTQETLVPNIHRKWLNIVIYRNTVVV